MQFMSKLNIGDKIELMMSDRVLKTFIISKTDITKKPELAISAQNTDNEILILTTCWPFNSQKPGTERYIVTAEALRQVAITIGVEPAFLSKVERDIVSPPSEGKIIALAEVLNEDPDLLLAMAGKVSSDLLAIVKARPQLIGELLRELKEQPDHAVLSVVRNITDGDW